MRSKGLDTFRKVLSMTIYPKDRNILQKTCDSGSTARVICLLDHLSKLPHALLFYTPLTVQSERIYDILRTYEISKREIVVEWTENMISSHLQKTENGTLDDVILWKFCPLHHSISQRGSIRSKPKDEISELKNLLFACIQFGKATVANAVMLYDERILNSKNDQGQTPLMFAALEKQKELFLLLAEKPYIPITSEDWAFLFEHIRDWVDVVHVLMKVFSDMKINYLYLYLSKVLTERFSNIYKTQTKEDIRFYVLALVLVDIHFTFSAKVWIQL